MRLELKWKRLCWVFLLIFKYFSYVLIHLIPIYINLFIFDLSLLGAFPECLSFRQVIQSYLSLFFSFKYI